MLRNKANPWEYFRPKVNKEILDAKQALQETIIGVLTESPTSLNRNQIRYEIRKKYPKIYYNLSEDALTDEILFLVAVEKIVLLSDRTLVPFFF